MSRRLLVSTLLVLGLDASTTALVPAGHPSLTQVAGAADFTGKIKNIRIKRRRTGSGYRVVAVSGSDSADQVASADVQLTDATTGELLETLQVDTALRGRVVLAGQVDPLAGGGGGTITVTLGLSDMIDHNGDPFGEQQEFEVSVDGLEARTAEDTTEDGWKARVRISDTGALTVVLGHEDKTWSGGGTVTATVTVDDHAPVALAVDEVRQRYIADLSEGIVIEDEIMLRATLKDADGQTLDTLEQLVLPPSETVEPGLSQATLKETQKGKAKLVSWTRSDGLDAALEVQLIDDATGEDVLMTTDDTPVRTQRGYRYDGLAFDPGEDPGGYPYLCLIDLIGDDGNPVGQQHEVDLWMPAAPEDGVDTEFYAVFADGTGIVGFVRDADGIGVHFAYEGEGVESVATAHLIFEEPFEGPAPLETEVAAELFVQWDKWLQKSADGVPDSYTLVTSLVTPEGEVLDTATTAGTGTGAVYATSRAAGTYHNRRDGQEEEYLMMAGD